MVSPMRLVEVVSQATGLPLATVTDLDRRLSTAQLRTTAGRGRSVARMTPRDAACLLAAVLASSQA